MDWVSPCAAVVQPVDVRWRIVPSAPTAHTSGVPFGSAEPPTANRLAPTPEGTDVMLLAPSMWKIRPPVPTIQTSSDFAPHTADSVGAGPAVIGSVSECQAPSK